MWFTYMHTSLTITSKNSHVLWMPVCNWSSAHLYTLMLCRSFNNFTGCLSTNVSSLKSFWSPLKYSRAQLLKISAIKFLFNCHLHDLWWNNKGIFLSTPKCFTKITTRELILHGSSAAALKNWSLFPWKFSISGT